MEAFLYPTHSISRLLGYIVLSSEMLWVLFFFMVKEPGGLLIQRSSLSKS
jgi:hypothetical protein